MTKGNIDGTSEGWGFAEYNWARNIMATNVVVYHPAPNAKLPVAAALGSPVIRQGLVYLFSSTCDASFDIACTSGRVFAAQVPDSVAALSNPNNYRYYDPSVPGGFTSHPITASTQPDSLIKESGKAAYPELVSVADFSRVVGYPGPGLEMVGLTTINGEYQVWHSASPFGPWTFETSGTLPDCTTSNTMTGFSLPCHALVAHPELSTGTGMVVSYLNQATLHLDALLVPW